MNRLLFLVFDFLGGGCSGWMDSGGSSGGGVRKTSVGAPHVFRIHCFPLSGFAL